MSAVSEIIYSPEEIRRKIQIAEHPDGSTVSCFSDPTGEIRSTVYKPFPGAALVYKDVHIPQFITNWRYGPVRALAIEYCLEGRLECQVGDDCLYVSPGDIIFFRTDPNLRVLQYPGSHYHAVTLMIYPDEPSPVLDLHLGMAGFSADQLSETYLPDGRYYSVLSRTEMLSDLFRSIVHMTDSVIHMYYGILIHWFLLRRILLPCRTSPIYVTVSVRTVSAPKCIISQKTAQFCEKSVHFRACFPPWNTTISVCPPHSPRRVSAAIHSGSCLLPQKDTPLPPQSRRRG